jgi:hypothetical protein
LTRQQTQSLDARVALVSAIVHRLEESAKRAGLASGWRQATMETLLPLSGKALREVEARAMTLDALSSARNDVADDPDMLGDPDVDLTYIPTHPCRYIDTRNVGGRIDGFRDFSLGNSGAVYGGTAACAPEPLFGDEDQIAALAVNVTIVDPAVAPGFVAVKPELSAPTSSLVNWYQAGPTVQAANQAVVRTLQDAGVSAEFFIQSSAPVHVVVDLFGVFMLPEATALDVVSVRTPWTSQGSFFTTADCPAGYTITGGGWRQHSGSFNPPANVTELSAHENNGWGCFINAGGQEKSGYCEAICARVPGR